MSRSDSTNGLVTVPPYNRASQVFLDCNPFKIMIVLQNPWCGVVVGPSSVTPWEAFLYLLRLYDGCLLAKSDLPVAATLHKQTANVQEPSVQRLVRRFRLRGRKIATGRMRS
jgi:hypothetical protein